MNHDVRSIGELSDEVFIEKMFKYLEILQEGRIKPNRIKQSSEENLSSGFTSTVRDSVDNFGDIHGVKKRINELFGIDQDYVNQLNITKKVTRNG